MVLKEHRKGMRMNMNEHIECQAYLFMKDCQNKVSALHPESQISNPTRGNTREKIEKFVAKKQQQKSTGTLWYLLHYLQAVYHTFRFLAIFWGDFSSCESLNEDATPHRKDGCPRYIAYPAYHTQAASSRNHLSVAREYVAKRVRQ